MMADISIFFTYRVLGVKELFALSVKKLSEMLISEHSKKS